ncbi:MAG: metalloprotease family protein [Candidatus Aenigmarchaeota archaeon]
MFIPGILIAVLTFPGVIIHELAHKIFCQLAGVKVYEVCYFSLGETAGYVRHEKAKRLRQAALITMAPLILNTLIAFLIFMTIFYFFRANSMFDLGLPNLFLGWLGASIAMHAFPSSGDADSLKHYARKTNIIWKVLTYPVIYLIKLANILRIVWFDLIYAVAIAGVAYLIFASAAIGFQNANRVDMGDVSEDFDKYYGEEVTILPRHRLSTDYPEWSTGKLMRVVEIWDRSSILLMPLEEDSSVIRNKYFFMKGIVTAVDKCACQYLVDGTWKLVEDPVPHADIPNLMDYSASTYPRTDCEGGFVESVYPEGQDFRCDPSVYAGMIYYIEATAPMWEYVDY